MEPFRKMPTHTRRDLLYNARYFAAILIPQITTAVVILFALPERGRLIWGLGLVAGIIGLPALSFWLAFRATRPARMRQFRRDDERQLGPPNPNETYVGIAYTNQAVHFGGESSWDRGYLAVHDGFVTFRGYGPKFRLPVEQIRRVWIDHFPSAHLKEKQSHVFVEWEHPKRGLRGFSLEARFVGSPTETTKQVQEIAQRFENLSPSTNPDAPKPIWPFELSQIQAAPHIHPMNFHGMDVAVAALAGGAANGIIAGARFLLFPEADVPGFHIAVLLIGTYVFQVALTQLTNRRNGPTPT